VFYEKAKTRLNNIPKRKHKEKKSKLSILRATKRKKLKKPFDTVMTNLGNQIAYNEILKVKKIRTFFSNDPVAQQFINIGFISNINRIVLPSDYFYY
jgi:hypothetical protein